MPANIDRGELDIYIGSQTRTLRFRTEQTMLLEKALGQDTLAFLGAGGSQIVFLVNAIFYGLQRRGQTSRKVTPTKVSDWLDNADDDNPITIDDEAVDRTQLQREILFAIARGKPGAEGRELVETLQESFMEQDQEVGADPTPLSQGSTSSPAQTI